MCGIVGVVHLDAGPPVDEQVFRRMCGTLAHRGPDDEGMRLFGTAAIGMRRLSIIDPATGHQPMCGASAGRWIVFNGEIYNYRELRDALARRGRNFRTKSDTEVVLALYDEFGAECVDHLRGMFAFAIWDDVAKRLFLARDRLGIKPLYVYHDARRLIFASEIKAIVADPTVMRELDHDALAVYLSLLYLPAPLTGFRNIRKLAPASTLTAEGGEVRTREYWDVAAGGPEVGSTSPTAEEIASAVDDAVRCHLVSDVPVGSFLSGGVDSTCVTQLAVRHSAERLSTYAVAFDDGHFDESAAARATSARLGTAHTESHVTNAAFDLGLVRKVLGGLDEPFGDLSAIPTFMVSAVAARGGKVVLSGDGGDELFAGYPHQANFDRLSRVGAFVPTPAARGAGLAAGALARVMGSHSLRRGGKALSLIGLEGPALMLALKRYFTEAEVRRFVHADRREAVSDAVVLETFELKLARTAHWPPLSRLLYVDLKVSLPDDMLFKVDRMSMLNSLEVRVPLLDHKLVELAFRIDPRRHIHGSGGKQVFKAALRDIVPADVLRRPKHGFEMPLHSWATHEFTGFIHDLLGPSRSADDRFFQWSEVKRLLDAFEGRVEPARIGLSRYQVNQRMWALVAWAYWARTWLGVAERA